MNADIHGSRAYSYPVKDVYDCILQLPGIVENFAVVERVDQTREDEYQFVFNLDIGMLRGNYTGNLYVTEKRPNEYLHLRATHKSGLGRLLASLKVRIHALSGESSELNLDGSIEVKGMVRFMGRKYLKTGVATGVEIVFNFLEQQLGLNRPET